MTMAMTFVFELSAHTFRTDIARRLARQRAACLRIQMVFEIDACRSPVGPSATAGTPVALSLLQMNRDVSVESKDAEAWARLYRQHGRLLFRRASVLLRDQDAAMDVLQEVFVRALNSKAPFDELTMPIHWLVRVTTNLCYKRGRDEGRRRRALMALSAASSEASCHDVELEHSVRNVLGRLPPSLREIAVCYFVDDMTQEEIAVTVKTPRRTVAYRLEKLRTYLVASISHQGNASSRRLSDLAAKENRRGPPIAA
jgi:RNA polymerase sigma factor (sigma-70 family)